MEVSACKQCLEHNEFLETQEGNLYLILIHIIKAEHFESWLHMKIKAGDFEHEKG